MRKSKERVSERISDRLEQSSAGEVTLRKLCLPADFALSRAVFFDAVRHRFAPLKLDSAMLEQLLEMQFRAQSSDYSNNYPQAEQLVIRFRKEDAGRLIIDFQSGVCRIVDIAILESFRGNGIGTRVLENVLAVTSLEQLPTKLTVEKTNPARRLYERLGFAPASDSEMFCEMQYEPRKID